MKSIFQFLNIETVFFLFISNKIVNYDHLCEKFDNYQDQDQDTFMSQIIISHDIIT